MIRCLKYRKLLMPYAEGVLPAETRTKVEEHLSRCAACSSEAAALRAVSGTLKGADFPATEPAADLWYQIQAKIEVPERRVKPWWQVGSFQAASAAGVAVVMLLAVVAYHQPLPVNNASRMPAAKLSAPQVDSNKRISRAVPKQTEDRIALVERDEPIHRSSG